MSLDSKGIRAKLTSHAEASGHFDRVNGHEPKNAPGNGLSCAVWVDDIHAIPRRSGLAATAARLAFNVRVSNPMLSEPQDDIDPTVLDAVDALFTAYVGDFDLGGTVAEIDVLGAHGDRLRARAGYLNQDNKIYRVMTITLPLILNDIWPQSA